MTRPISMLELFLLFTIQLFASDVLAPEYLDFSISGGEIRCSTLESGRGLDVRTVAEKDTLVFQIQAVPGRNGDCRVSLPGNIRKIRLFDCEFDVPEGKESAYFRAHRMYDIQPPWYKFGKAETMHCYLWIQFGEEPGDGKVFSGKRIVIDRSKENVLYKRENDFRCLVAPDGQVFEWWGDKPDWSRARPYVLSRDFTVMDGKLYASVSGSLRYYKGLIRAEIPFDAPFEIPKYNPDLRTGLRLNAPHRIDFLRKFYGGNPYLRKSESEFLAFLKKTEFLRTGMSPDEVKTILGNPDVTQKNGPKRNSETGAELVFRYYFLRMDKFNVNMKDMYIDVRFRSFPDGSASLRAID